MSAADMAARYQVGYQRVAEYPAERSGFGSTYIENASCFFFPFLNNIIY
jgi:hypothetical protein